MSSLVTIKANANSIILKLSKNAPIEDVLKEICYKFAHNRNFFGNFNIVLKVEGRDLTDEELEAVVQSIEYNSNVTVSLIDVQNTELNTIALKRLFSEKENFKDSHFKVIYNFDNEKIVHSDEGLLILCDVPENVKLYAGGNIIVIGDLKGYATAGIPDRNNCFIIADTFSSEKLSIGTRECDMPPIKKRLFHKRRRSVLLIFENDKFILNDLGNIDLEKHLRKRK